MAVSLASFLLFLMPVAYCLPTGNVTDILVGSGRIFGGSNVDIRQIPYIVQILQYNQQFCGGTIISKQWIVSAAHCFTEVRRTSDITIGSGSSRRDYGQKHQVARIIMHPNYDDESSDNDIALLKLAKPMTFNQNQKSIAITTSIPKAGEKMVTSGWGKTEYVLSSRDLLATVVYVVDYNKCRYTYGSTKNMFCAAKSGADSCQGDSGGPAVVNGKLTGVVSYGNGCAKPGYPGVYTQLYNYRQWIARQTGLAL